MKGFLPALLGGLLAGIGAWVAQSFGGSHGVSAVSAAIGGFIGVAIAQAHLIRRIASPAVDFVICPSKGRGVLYVSSWSRYYLWFMDDPHAA